MQDRVQEPHDRKALGSRLGVARVDLTGVGDRVRQRGLFAVVTLDELTNLVGLGDHRARGSPGREAQVLEHRGVQRIGDRDDEVVPFDADGNDAEGVCRRPIDERERIRARLDLIQIDRLHAGLLAEGERDVSRSREAEVDQALANQAPVATLFGERLLDLPLADHAAVLEDLSEQAPALGRLAHRRASRSVRS